MKQTNMAKKKTTQNSSSSKSNAGISTAQKVGFGITAAAVTAAGAYFLYGSKNAPKNRKKVKGWVLKAKGEVLEALEKAEEITEDEYNNIVETASDAYAGVKNASASEIKEFKKEMKDHWATLQKSKALKQVVAAGVGVVSELAKKKVKSTVRKKIKKATTKKSS